jgi:pSer/pThr/pTyr-binding forkhead associated (FHA) protein
VLPRHGFPAAEGDTRSFALNPTEVLGPGDLVVVHGTDVRTVPSARGSATIGRSAHNDIVIDRPGVSRDHAVLERRADGWWVVPGTSKNGTRLDGRILDGPVRIEGQGELSLGRGVRLRLSVEPVAQRERA